MDENSYSDPFIPAYVFHEPVVKYIRREIPTILINDCGDAYKHFKKFFDEQIEEKNKEHLIFAGLDARNKVKITKILTIGTDKQCLVSPKEIIKECLLFDCSGFIVCHNHPSLDPSPSSADASITRQIRAACEVMQIHFFDHIILGEPSNDPLGIGYYSFRRNSGLL